MKQGWMERFDLQNTPLPTQSLMEIAGCQRVLIEHHGGVTAYGREMICVKVKFGAVCIHGQNLVMKRMTKDQLIICGCIECVKLERSVHQNA